MESSGQKSRLLVLAGLVLAILCGALALPARAQEKEPAQKASGQSAQQKSSAEKEMEAQMETAMKAYEAQLKAEADQRAKDPAWKPTHQQVNVIKVQPGAKGEALHNFCLNLDGNILAGVGGQRWEYIVDEKTRQYKPQLISEPAEIRVFSPEGKLLDTWKLEVMPQALCVHRDGTIFVGGDGRLAKLSPQGKVLAFADSPAVASDKPKPKPEEKKDAKKENQQAKTKQKNSPGVLVGLARALGLEEEKSQDKSILDDDDSPRLTAEMAAMMARRKREVTGIAVSEQDLFVATAMREGYGYAVWRVDHNFQNPQQIVSGLPGCCGQMDIQARNGELWIPENGRHRVARYDRDGKLLSSFGKRDRKSAEGFGGCCEPKNLRVTAQGDVLTAESGPPVAIKRFSPDGKFLGVVGVPTYPTGCVRVTVEISKDGGKVFILNPGDSAIHVLADQRETATHEQTSTITIPGGERRGQLRTFCLAGDGNLLAACGGEQTTFVRGTSGIEAKVTGEPAEIKVLSPEGKLLATWKLDVMPQAVNVAPDGTIYVGGQGRVARLDKQGKVLRTADAPHMAELGPLPPLPEKKEPKPESEEEAKAKQAKIEELRAKAKSAVAALREAARQLSAGAAGEKPSAEANAKYQEAMQAYIKANEDLREATITPEVLAMQKRAALAHKSAVTGIAATDQHVFVACPETKGYGFAVWRTDRDFGSPKKIVTGLRGCCGNMDIQAFGGDLYVAENARKRVVRYDPEGKELAAWGESDRKGIEGFGSCCNPMCIRFGPGGKVYTSESNVGSIKRFSPDGQFLGLVGTVKIVPGCKHVPIGISGDSRRVYMLDITRSHIVVMTPCGAAGQTAANQ